MWPHYSAVGRLQGGFGERESKPGKETSFAAVCSRVPRTPLQTAGKETCLHGGSGNARANRGRRPASPRFALAFPEPPCKPQGRRPACTGVRGTREQTGEGDQLRRGLLSRSPNPPANRREGDLLARGFGERESKPGKETSFPAVCSRVPRTPLQTAGKETCLHGGSGNARANRGRRPASPRFALAFPEPPCKPQGRRPACTGVRGTREQTGEGDQLRRGLLSRSPNPPANRREGDLLARGFGERESKPGKETCLITRGFLRYAGIPAYSTEVKKSAGKCLHLITSAGSPALDPLHPRQNGSTASAANRELQRWWCPADVYTS
ncbi:uncharacterized protein LOC127046667 [Gopherus flavomarginatus]|uniref:uncharacterized protein LOC127046667 n=1 Tax=Gopherus flavomarginatus TaxID=286002 RepID=UPI0021CBF94D|nr:uncharacterized protein LOC127046667 [Gopherus flavomarginatus]